ncbi:MAG: PQQ-binding-like beta-propeller repeat protein [Myxococcales bacterium]|nr:PQQ-binding-like beta-propeller repeat protein [Myxococcales bacterium]
MSCCPRWLAVLFAVAACGTRAAPPPPPSNHPADAAAITAPWALAVADGAAGLIDDRVFAWDRAWADGGGGVAEYATRDGALVRTRAIAGLRVNGAPDFWERVPGGYLASWDGPTFIRETGDALAVAWVGAGDDWFDSHAIVDGGLVIGRGRAGAAVVRLDLTTGRERWRAPLVAWSQDVTVEVDRTSAYGTWQEYDPQAPTPTMTIPRRVRAYDLATGGARWTYDFTAPPDRLAVARDTIVAAYNDRLELIDGATGKVRARPALAPTNASLLIDDAQVIAIDRDAVVALELSTGHERWRVPATFDGRPQLARHGGDVLVTTEAGKVMAIDRARGTVGWTVGVGLEAYRLWTSPSAVVLVGPGVAGMALPPTTPAESAHIRGRVIAGGCGPVASAQVTVDGRPVALAADGTFATTVTGRGVIEVQVAPSLDDAMAWEGRARATTARVTLDGRGAYVVPDLPVGWCGG